MHHLAGGLNAIFNVAVSCGCQRIEKYMCNVWLELAIPGW